MICGLNDLKGKKPYDVVDLHTHQGCFTVSSSHLVAVPGDAGRVLRQRRGGGSIGGLCLCIEGTRFGVCVFSPTAESFGVSAQIGSGVVLGGREVSTRFCEGSGRAGCCWGYRLSCFSFCEEENAKDLGASLKREAKRALRNHAKNQLNEGN